MAEKFLRIRFIRPGQPIPRATFTFTGFPPESFWQELADWYLRDKPFQGFRGRKYLTVNIIVPKGGKKGERFGKQAS